MTSRRLFSLLSAVVVLAMTPGMSVAQVRYHVTYLGNWYPASINNKTQIVGSDYGDFSGFYQHAVLWSNGTLSDLGSLGGMNAESIGTGINDSGQITGYSTLSGGLYNPNNPEVFFISNGVMTDLGPSTHRAFGINASGQLAGTLQNNHAFFYNGAITDLGGFGSYPYTEGFAINKSGDIVGIAGSSLGYHLFRYSGGVMQDLSIQAVDYCSGYMSGGLVINDSGQIAGCWLIGSPQTGYTHAFRYSAGVLTDFGTLGGTNSDARGLNNFGQMVGVSDMATPNVTHGFVYTYSGGAVYDVNTLLDSSSTGWTVRYATNINDVGQIVGYGVNTNGVWGGLLMSPVVAANCQPAVYATQFADVTGDGKADAIAVNDAGVLVSPSDGTQFTTPQAWTNGPYYGVYHPEKQTIGNIFFADVTGDGKADAIVVNDGGVTVRRSNGSSFLPNETWLRGVAFGIYHDKNGRGYGNIFFADVTGDGKADAIAISDKAVTVYPSNGSQFLKGQTWATPGTYSPSGTFFADVTGDGLADAVFVDAKGLVTVMPSTGSSFDRAQLWKSPGYPVSSAWSTFADVNNDGKSDQVINVPGDSSLVSYSNGSSMLARQNWTTAPFAGTIGTYFADVTGDGKIDAIALSQNQTIVRRWSPAGFGNDETWSGIPFYGMRDPVCH